MLLPALLVFGWIGVVSFGGGLAVVPEMHRQLVEMHPWLTQAEFADGYAFGQLAPGPNMLSVVFYGYRAAGLWGAVLAPVAAFAPGVIASTVLARVWTSASKPSGLLAIRRGLVPVGAGLIAAGVFVLARGTISDWRAALLVAGVIVVVQRKLVTNAVAVVSAALLGMLLGL
jgi:chromate transporter